MVGFEKYKGNQSNYQRWQLFTGALVTYFMEGPNIAF
jgi:hypothetical protein